MSKFDGKNRRISILSYPAAQIRMVLVFAVLAFIFASVNFYVSRQAMEKLKTEIRNELVSSGQQHDVDVVFKQTTKNLYIQLTLLTVLCFVMLCLASLVISHRVAGPIYHLRKYMSGVLDGSVEQRKVRFRKDDFFHDYATVFNDFQELFLGEPKPSETAPAGDDTSAS